MRTELDTIDVPEEQLRILQEVLSEEITVTTPGGGRSKVGVREALCQMLASDGMKGSKRTSILKRITALIENRAAARHALLASQGRQQRGPLWPLMVGGVISNPTEFSYEEMLKILDNAPLDSVEVQRLVAAARHDQSILTLEMTEKMQAEKASRLSVQQAKSGRSS